MMGDGERLIPETVVVQHGDRWAIRPVVRVEAFPPDMHPFSPIRDALTAVRATADNGSVRWWGFARAWIGEDLRMHVAGWDPRNEVIANWDSPEEG